MFDQRGAGKSTPWASLEDITTWHTVSDMEEIRKKLGIEKWAFFGGSWGACISLAYAQTHPTRCLGLILRGIFTLRRTELEWFYQKGSGGNENIFPDQMIGFHGNNNLGLGVANALKCIELGKPSRTVPPLAFILALVLVSTSTSSPEGLAGLGAFFVVFIAVGISPFSLKYCFGNTSIVLSIGAFSLA